MKYFLVGLMVLGTMSAYSKSLTCTVESGKGLTYLPTTVTLDTEVKETGRGLSYIYYKGFDQTGNSYGGGQAYFKDLNPQIVSQVKQFDDAKVVVNFVII